MAETKRKTPAIPERYLGERWVVPQFIEFPEFQEPPAPANPVIPFVRGQWLADDEPLLPEGAFSHYWPFPYFEQPPPPANPVIGYVYGYSLREHPVVFMGGRFSSFPYFQSAQSQGGGGLCMIMGLGR